MNKKVSVSSESGSPATHLVLVFENDEFVCGGFLYADSSVLLHFSTGERLATPNLEALDPSLEQQLLPIDSTEAQEIVQKAWSQLLAAKPQRPS